MASKLKRSGRYWLLPIERAKPIEIDGETSLELRFDDGAHGVLRIDGEFSIRSGDDAIDIEPRRGWTRNVLDSLIGAEVKIAKADRRGNLCITFSDSRVLLIADGPYENWHFANDDHIRVHGGAGRLIE